MTDNTPKLLSEHRAFGGLQRFVEHHSLEIGLPMRFSVYLPPQAAHERVPALLYLAGLTCNEETFAIKAGAQRMAASLGIALIAPDTSPRGPEVEGIPGARDNWDFGIGAGFYLDALAEPWATHWRMESWIVQELLPLVARHFPIDGERIGIFGHSMGGHGALTLALRHPGRFRSLSAFAPICAPTQCPWGEKAFAGYLGEPGVAGIVSATRGNHGQSLAFAARRHGVKVTIVVPHGNSAEKNAAMRDHDEIGRAHV